MEKKTAISMRGITKRFGSVVANNHVDLDVHEGEILSVLGENGCGKTTLMNMLAGIYYPDEGSIYKDGKEVVIRSPKDAFDLKIGMIHQHFKLVDLFTAAENIVLGIHEDGKYNLKNVNTRVSEIAEKYGFHIDPQKKIYEMSVSEKQTVEIIKVLYRGADILILDEPTAVLTPQEIEHLFRVLKSMKADGKSIIIITHKLHEVLEVSDRVAILRKGEHVATVNTAEATEASLTEMMVGKKISLNIDRIDPVKPETRLNIKHLNCLNAEGVPVVKDVTDTWAAIELGKEKGYREFWIYGGTGGRFDHTLANVQTLAALAELGMQGYLVGMTQIITAVSGKTMEFGPERSGFLSVFAHTDRCAGVSMEGLKYELQNAELSNRFPLGVSNEFLGVPGKLTVGEGIAIVVMERTK